MSITVEEMNLISIYHEDTRAGQLARLRAVRPLYLGDPELLSVVDSAARKVEAMTAADFLATAFELTPPVLYAEGETAPKMMSVGMHCRLLGRPGRFRALQRFLDYIQQHDKVWVCTRQQIADHWRETHPYRG